MRRVLAKKWVRGVGLMVFVGAFVLGFVGVTTYVSAPTDDGIQTEERGIQLATTSLDELDQNEATSSVPIEYLEVMDGCGADYQGSCVRVRSGPGMVYSVTSRLRKGVVLKVVDTVVRDGHTWYKIRLDEGGILYPDRITDTWYIAAEVVRPFYDIGVRYLAPGQKATTTKRILVNLSTQTLDAYDGDTLFMEQKISSGLPGTPTPTGTFTIYKMTPSRYMQGPLPGSGSDQEYDLPGVPWDMYFTQDGAVIHGAYWHNNFGRQWSHGCVNLPLDKARELYYWADVGIPVTIRD